MLWCDNDVMWPPLCQFPNLAVVKGAEGQMCNNPLSLSHRPLWRPLLNNKSWEQETQREKERGNSVPFDGGSLFAWKLVGELRGALSEAGLFFLLPSLSTFFHGYREFFFLYFPELFLSPFSQQRFDLLFFFSNMCVHILMSWAVSWDFNISFSTQILKHCLNFSSFFGVGGRVLFMIKCYNSTLTCSNAQFSWYFSIMILGFTAWVGVGFIFCNSFFFLPWFTLNNLIFLLGRIFLFFQSNSPSLGSFWFLSLSLSLLCPISCCLLWLTRRSELFFLLCLDYAYDDALFGNSSSVLVQAFL